MSDHRPSEQDLWHAWREFLSVGAMISLMFAAIGGAGFLILYALIHWMG